MTRSRVSPAHVCNVRTDASHIQTRCRLIAPSAAAYATLQLNCDTHLNNGHTHAAKAPPMFECSYRCGKCNSCHTRPRHHRLEPQPAKHKLGRQSATHYCTLLTVNRRKRNVVRQPLSCSRRWSGVANACHVKNPSVRTHMHARKSAARPLPITAMCGGMPSHTLSHMLLPFPSNPGHTQVLLTQGGV